MDPALIFGGRSEVKSGPTSWAFLGFRDGACGGSPDFELGREWSPTSETSSAQSMLVTGVPIPSASAVVLTVFTLTLLPFNLSHNGLLPLLIPLAFGNDEVNGSAEGGQWLPLLVGCVCRGIVEVAALSSDAVDAFSERCLGCSIATISGVIL